MKYLTLFLLPIFLLLCGNTKAQDTITAERTSIVTLSLLAPTVSYAPRYNVGYMHRVAPRWWAGLEAGYGTYGSSFGMGTENNDQLTKDYRIFELRPEVFYSLRSPSRKLKHLVSAEFFYINHTDHFTTDHYYGDNGYPRYNYDAADYKRIKTGLNINYSLLFYFSERFGLIWKTGFGVRHRNVTYSNVVNKTMQDNSSDDELFNMFNADKYIEQSGAETNLNFTTDLKLFYKF